MFIKIISMLLSIFVIAENAGAVNVPEHKLAVSSQACTLGRGASRATSVVSGIFSHDSSFSERQKQLDKILSLTYTSIIDPYQRAMFIARLFRKRQDKDKALELIQNILASLDENNFFRRNRIYSCIAVLYEESSDKGEALEIIKKEAIEPLLLAITDWNAPYNFSEISRSIAILYKDEGDKTPAFREIGQLLDHNLNISKTEYLSEHIYVNFAEAFAVLGCSSDFKETAYAIIKNKVLPKVHGAESHEVCHWLAVLCGDDREKIEEIGSILLDRYKKDNSLANFCTVSEAMVSLYELSEDISPVIGFIEKGLHTIESSNINFIEGDCSWLNVIISCIAKLGNKAGGKEAALRIILKIRDMTKRIAKNDAPEEAEKPYNKSLEYITKAVAELHKDTADLDELNKATDFLEKLLTEKEVFYNTKYVIYEALASIYASFPDGISKMRVNIPFDDWHLNISSRACARLIGKYKKAGDKAEYVLFLGDLCKKIFDNPPKFPEVEKKCADFFYTAACSLGAVFEDVEMSADAYCLLSQIIKISKKFRDNSAKRTIIESVFKCASYLYKTEENRSMALCLISESLKLLTGEDYSICYISDISAFFDIVDSVERFVHEKRDLSESLTGASMSADCGLGRLFGLQQACVRNLLNNSTAAVRKAVLTEKIRSILLRNGLSLVESSAQIIAKYKDKGFVPDFGCKYDPRYDVERLMGELEEPAGAEPKEVLEILRELGFRTDKNGYILHPMDALTTVYRGSMEVDNARSDRATHDATLAIIGYGIAGGEMAPRVGDALTVSKGRRALHEVDYALINYEGVIGYSRNFETDKGETGQERGPLVFVFQEPIPLYARKAKHLLDGRTTEKTIEETTERQVKERICEANILNIMRWLVKGRVNKRDIKTAVELLKENIARLKDIQDDLYFTAMYEYMDDRFFLDLESAYLSSGMNVDSLSILLRKAMQRHTRRLKNRYKDADSEKPERWDMFLESLAQRNRIWGRKKLSLYGYLLHKEWLRKGTHDAARPDIKKELVKLGEINSGERKDSVSSMEKKSGFRVFAAAHAISFAAAVNGNGNVRSTLKGRLPTDAFLMSFRPDTAWLPKENDGFHNIAHLARVLVMAELLIRVRGLSGEEANAVRWSAVTHDIKRAFAAGNAQIHGDLSADWAMRNPQIFVTPNPANTEAIAYLNRWHAREDSDCPEMTDSLKIVKDADALDRARLLKDLDPRYLRLEESKGLIYFAQELYNLSKKIIREYDVPEFEAVILAGKILGIVEGSITLEGCRQENNPKAQRRYSDRTARCSV